MERIVVGLTGPIASGKGTVADYLVKELGFKYFSLSDRIREEVRLRKWGEGREILQNVGDELRQRFGFDVLAKRTAEMADFKLADRIVIDSIRHPEEIRYLWDCFDASVIGITASYEHLFRNMKERGRKSDAETFEEFLAMQKREVGQEGSNAMNVVECLKMANRIIINEGTKEELVWKTNWALMEEGIGIKSIQRERER